MFSHVGGLPRNLGDKQLFEVLFPLQNIHLEHALLVESLLLNFLIRHILVLQYFFDLFAVNLRMASKKNKVDFFLPFNCHDSNCPDSLPSSLTKILSNIVGLYFTRHQLESIVIDEAVISLFNISSWLELNRTISDDKLAIDPLINFDFVTLRILVSVLVVELAGLREKYLLVGGEHVETKELLQNIVLHLYLF